jgi:hypothetical protein
MSLSPVFKNQALGGTVFVLDKLSRYYLSYIIQISMIIYEILKLPDLINPLFQH